MDRAALLTLLLVAGLACSTGGSSGPGGSGGKPADPAAGKGEDRPCDAKVVPMADPSQRQIQCANGLSFVVRLGSDGKWYEEMKVRAGIRPGYSTPEEAARALCCGPAER
jgi:hypothetical protein